ncbi:MAG: phytanoyl-CoA dioxygenase family protein [Dehalococcoidia bacterium]
MGHLQAATATVEDVCERLDGDGYAIIEGVLAPPEVASIREELHRILAATPQGRNDFEGFKTQRIYALFAKTRMLDGPATHPLVLGVLDRVLERYQLSQPTAISIGPGETAQNLHTDDSVYPLPRPHPEVVANCMWAIDDFTAENGATNILPRSHRDAPVPEDRFDYSQTIQAVMPAGSLCIFVGSLFHAGGANRSDRPRLGVILEYCAGWLRPQENHYLAVPRETARELPERLQQLLGYEVHGLLGNVDGRHPRRVLTAEA